MSRGLRAGLEARKPGETYWGAVAPDVYVDDYRNRLLFLVLAGSANALDITPISPPRGLPPDVSLGVRTVYESWAELASDVSWVTYSELLSAMHRLRETADRFDSASDGKEEWLANYVSVSGQAVTAFLAVYEANGWETRMVFWITEL